jgi:hypothetical protein
MARFRVIHQASCEEWEVEAENGEKARRVVGWPESLCRVLELRRGPYAAIVPPKVAAQIYPPIPGSTQVCPDCNITMMEEPGRDFWWRCPSCDLLYHEWDNKIFRAGEIE